MHVYGWVCRVLGLTGTFSLQPFGHTPGCCCCSAAAAAAAAAAACCVIQLMALMGAVVAAAAAAAAGAILWEGACHVCTTDCLLLTNWRRGLSFSPALLLKSASAIPLLLLLLLVHLLPLLLLLLVHLLPLLLLLHLLVVVVVCCACLQPFTAVSERVVQCSCPASAAAAEDWSSGAGSAEDAVKSMLGWSPAAVNSWSSCC